MRRTISTSDDILDPRDIEKRIAELESERDDHIQTCKNCSRPITRTDESAKDVIADPWRVDDGGVVCPDREGGAYLAHVPDPDCTWEAENEADAEELKTWIDVRDDCGSREWPHGLTLIRDSYFETYAQELAEDIGALEKCDSWPATCIDWERAARELQQDYSMVVIDGEDYHYRD